MNPAAVDVAFNERLRRHEAAHCAGALICNLNVDEVWVGTHNVTDLDLDSEGTAGLTRIDAPNTPDGHRLMAIAIMAGPLEDGEAGWPRPWPLPRADTAPDEWDFAEHVRAAGLDEQGYLELCAEAKAITETPEFGRLHQSIVDALAEPPHALGTAELKHLHKQALMEHKYVNVADATTLTEGEMLALASTYDIDKVGDRVIPGAYAGTIERIKAGTTLPLIWGHDANGSPQNWVGKIIDAAETQDGLQVHARFDLEDSVARKAWNLVRDGSIDKLSIGYTIPAGGRRRGSDGANELTTVDLHEVSLVMVPANEGARVLAVKGTDDFDRVRTDTRDFMLNVMGATSVPRTEVTRAPLDIKALERELTPITITTFAA